MIIRFENCDPGEQYITLNRVSITSTEFYHLPFRICYISYKRLPGLRLFIKLLSYIHEPEYLP